MADKKPVKPMGVGDMSSIKKHYSLEESIVKKSILSISKFSSQVSKRDDLVEYARAKKAEEQKMELSSLAIETNSRLTELSRQGTKDAELQMIDEVNEYKRRQREIMNEEYEDDLEDQGSQAKSILGDALKGAVAGFSVGKVMDAIVPREQLDNMTEVREAYIRTFGSEEDYKEIKANLYDHLRETNKMLGVAAFSGEDISEGMRQAILAKVPSSLAESFALSSAKLKVVGADLGDSTAQSMTMAFGDSASMIMDDIADVLASAPISDAVKTSIVESTAEVGTYLSQIESDPEKLSQSVAQYASAIATLDQSNIMDIEQAKQIQELLVQATLGDTDAMANIARLGADVDDVTTAVEQGEWGTAFQSVLDGIASLPEHAEALKAMDLGFDEKNIRQIQNRRDEIADLGATTREVYEQSRLEVDGLSQAEIRAKEITKASMASRIKNWLSLNPVVEMSSGLLEKMNVNASTASTVVGTVAGVGKNVAETAILMNASGLKMSSMLGGVAKIGSKVGPIMASAGAAIAGVGSAALPVLAVVAAVAAVAGGAYLLYKNWDSVTEWFGEKWDWLKEKVSAFKEKLSPVTDMMTSIKEKMIGVFESLPKPIQIVIDKISTLLLPVKGLMEFGGKVKDFVTGDGVKEVGGKVVSGIKGAGSSIASWFTGGKKEASTIQVEAPMKTRTATTQGEAQEIEKARRKSPAENKMEVNKEIRDNRMLGESQDTNKILRGILEYLKKTDKVTIDIPELS